MSKDAETDPSLGDSNNIGVGGRGAREGRGGAPAGARGVPPGAPASVLKVIDPSLTRLQVCCPLLLIIFIASLSLTPNENRAILGASGTGEG